LLGKKERKKKRREGLCFCVSPELQKDLLYRGLVEEKKLASSIKQGSKKGAEN